MSDPVDRVDRRRPMIFGHDTAFTQLQENGRVASFRTKKRLRGPVWIRRSRTGPKEFDAEIVEVQEVTAENMMRKLNYWGVLSGFDSADAWRQAIHEVHGDDIEEGYIHIVTRE